MHVEVRVLAATNKQLEAAVSKGEFREDLFFRLNVVRMEVPPLRQRRQDLPLLCRQFVDRPFRIAGSVGFLYGLNTLGAALGCALAGFVLLPAWGVARTVGLGAALNLAAGAEYPV